MYIGRRKIFPNTGVMDMNTVWAGRVASRVVGGLVVTSVLFAGASTVFCEHRF